MALIQQDWVGLAPDPLINMQAPGTGLEALTPGTCRGQTHTEPPRAGRSGCFQLEVPACEGLTEAQGRRATGEQKGRVLWRARQATERTRP